ncbi:CDP-alcohol phosphatidyltransferase family protein [Curtobacterium sp. MCBD17_034]|uniref:CDP-alcohol phosphatidyltransferase family protein n=1 Tax=unclassified Curtobacterium TaxID=257496 RepID=UPI000DAA20ED|nr:MULTISPECIES: CDP-alcohol phosphatidyltransferase family protein [unclassified Curtobacterium]PZF57954.1 CDP-alcohol phosphatidyltransferase family protein [Curtobacterium sp. MCBD17_034]PZM33393.1 CDP-alcohol phosphatidyltransferase family protein [Curtobacterium sp. MCBD17_031]WIE53834.1 CDP-alcohol phosphatidyltransferase family protein [Curtobacterium sp. MCBD17_003]
MTDDQIPEHVPGESGADDESLPQDRPFGDHGEHAYDRPRSIAELRAVTQPDEVRSRANAEHWTASLYLRDVSPYLTWFLLRTRISANQVTGVMILVGWSTAAALLVPGLLGAALALVLGQLQMLVDCSDGEVARWRGTRSPAGVFLDKVGHYTTEGLIPAALGVRAATWPVHGGDYAWTTIGFALALVIVLNKALNDMVHVARANAGLDRLVDRRDHTTVPSGRRLASLRQVARFLPFHRLYHSVELTILAFVFALLGLVMGHPLADRILVGALLPLSVLALAGHFLAIIASKRVRA